LNVQHAEPATRLGKLKKKIKKKNKPKKKKKGSY